MVGNNVFPSLTLCLCSSSPQHIHTHTAAIILFSGLGSIEVAQESLSVGIGALAGSTIMLLTVPWGLSVFAGRVDILDGNKPNYTKRPKLTEDAGWKHTLSHTGVAVTDEIRHGSVIMAITTLPYFLIQVPASFLHGPSEDVAAGEHWWALGGTHTLVSLLVHAPNSTKVNLHPSFLYLVQVSSSVWLA